MELTRRHRLWRRGRAESAAGWHFYSGVLLHLVGKLSSSHAAAAATRTHRSHPRRWLWFPFEKALRAARLHVGRDPRWVYSSIAQGHPVHVAEPLMFLFFLNRGSTCRRLAGCGAHLPGWSLKKTRRGSLSVSSISNIDHLG